MDCARLGRLIRMLRLERGYTQRALADELGLSPKTISKWERGLGCPDVSILGPLSRLLGVDLTRMLEGELSPNEAVGGNMKKSKVYVCPVCGNIILTCAAAEISCCGRRLLALEARKAAPEEKLQVEPMEDEWFISSEHSMEKDNYISFVAFLTGAKAELIKQYPEWNLQLRIPRRGHGMLLWYAEREGLLYQLL